MILDWNRQQMHGVTIHVKWFLIEIKMLVIFYLANCLWFVENTTTTHFEIVNKSNLFHIHRFSSK